ncbi:hypothetical protein FNF27_07588 [Cafeteria roenbergensis]|uniref:EF-hand domain-containing protein n=1 Tax=Cafeteria roenbergensis TaxID=33653 RepID=A0A5A8DJY9_CAFRO|nr:hypothetical protein FNF27_07588 [Cafeteria roenbergensis]|mmetsp:Transcript_11321/g.43695  ORF Transcript_11321/g.43695 Transcript_11321/m.43695 type:complete len:349 (-) Transcript_11321:148-1194(-)
MGLCASAQERGPSPLQIRTQRAIQQLQAERSAPSSSRTLTKIVLQFPRVKKAFRTVRLVWRRFDADGNGTLDFDELCRCLEAMGAHVTPADAHDMFKEADVDDSKGLDFREFIVALALGCVLQLVPDEEGAGPAPRRAAVPGSDKDVVSRSNPLASASSLKPPTLGERGRSKSYVRTKQMSAVVSAMRICLETFMLFDDNGDGVLQREEVTKQLREKSRNARRHSGVGFGAASFLSQERWDAMAWDRRGQVTFREFCLSFYDWICPDGDTSAMGDEDEEEDDDPMLAVGPHKSTPRAPRGLLPLRESDDGSLCDSDVEDVTVVEKGSASPPASANSRAVPLPPPVPPP